MDEALILSDEGVLTASLRASFGSGLSILPQSLASTLLGPFEVVHRFLLNSRSWVLSRYATLAFPQANTSGKLAPFASWDIRIRAPEGLQASGASAGLGIALLFIEHGVRGLFEWLGCDVRFPVLAATGLLDSDRNVGPVGGIEDKLGTFRRWLEERGRGEIWLFLPERQRAEIERSRELEQIARHAVPCFVSSLDDVLDVFVRRIGLAEQTPPSSPWSAPRRLSVAAHRELFCPSDEGDLPSGLDRSAVDDQGSAGARLDELVVPLVEASRVPDRRRPPARRRRWLRASAAGGLLLLGAAAGATAIGAAFSHARRGDVRPAGAIPAASAEATGPIDGRRAAGTGTTATAQAASPVAPTAPPRRAAGIMSSAATIVSSPPEAHRAAMPVPPAGPRRSMRPMGPGAPVVALASPLVVRGGPAVDPSRGRLAALCSPHEQDAAAWRGCVSRVVLQHCLGAEAPPECRGEFARQQIGQLREHECSHHPDRSACISPAEAIMRVLEPKP